ncbi:MFS transporter [Streptomonospora litoralis]|uniref:Major Facilitator Superfamily protein n=1 Tax=Streptomonospora litoralis TaxID=2498135 RepID=A0A4P6Q1Z7_9ACTN|nr:MFS transporter [Streptomonospora litoralis]QBI54575.1 Major Facilitator Superfamily protein [Streptomonospora litoralis]
MHSSTGPTGERGAGSGTGGDAAPKARASGRFITLLVLNQFGIWLAILPPATVTLALRVEQVVGPAEKESALARLLSIGVLLALVGTPLFGRLSDRTSGRLGRRRPWILGGIVMTFAALTLVATGPTVPLLLAGWCLAQLSISAAFAATTALIPDKIPVEQRGFVSGLMGMMIPVGTLAGHFLVQLAPNIQQYPGSIVLMFLAPAGAGVLACTAFVVLVGDTDQPPAVLEPYGLRQFLRSFWVNPVRHPDFAWTFASRFLVYMGYSTLMGYQVYYLTDHLGRSSGETPRLVFYVTLAMALASVASAWSGGKWSDRTGRRKPFVFGSAAVMALGFAGVAYAPEYPVFLAMAAVIGLGHGLFLAVDLALVSQVLPNPDDTAKDMGVFNFANTLPQSLAPALAPYLLAIGAAGGTGNYAALFVAAAVFGLAGAVAIYPVAQAR